MTPLARAGLAVAVAGVAAGLIPLSYHGTSCGTAWIQTDAADVADLTRTLGGAVADGETGLSPFSDGCSSAKQPIRIVSGVLVVLGAGLALAGGSQPKPVEPTRQPGASAWKRDEDEQSQA